MWFKLGLLVLIAAPSEAMVVELVPPVGTPLTAAQIAQLDDLRGFMEPKNSWNLLSRLIIPPDFPMRSLQRRRFGDDFAQFDYERKNGIGTFTFQQQGAWSGGPNDKALVGIINASRGKDALWNVIYDGRLFSNGAGENPRNLSGPELTDFFEHSVNHWLEYFQLLSRGLKVRSQSIFERTEGSDWKQLR